jgi:hypothetical protein
MIITTEPEPEVRHVSALTPPAQFMMPTAQRLPNNTWAISFDEGLVVVPHFVATMTMESYTEYFRTNKDHLILLELRTKP